METKTAFCDVPNCCRLSANNQYHLCKKHIEAMTFLIWALDNIKVKEPPKERPSGLVLPK